eukprot:Amastigsp_a842679_8.p5 type:complete len:139 gc:universal Amastigsp_a842679_8:461-45(-)
MPAATHRARASKRLDVQKRENKYNKLVREHTEGVVARRHSAAFDVAEQKKNIAVAEPEGAPSRCARDATASLEKQLLAIKRHTCSCLNREQERAHGLGHVNPELERVPGPLQRHATQRRRCRRLCAFGIRGTFRIHES